MADIPSLTDLLEYSRKVDHGTKHGLIASSIVNFVSVCAIMLLLRQAMGVDVQTWWGLAAFGVFELIILGVWFYRQIKIFDSKVLSIGFAINADASSQDYYLDIKRAFQQHIDSRGLSELVRIKDLPSDKRFKDKNAAEKFVLDKGLRVLIWGDTTKGTRNGDEVSIFNIKISYQHAAIDDHNKSELLDGIGTLFKQRSWGIQKTSSLEGLQIVAGNMIEISLFTFAACLTYTSSVDYVEKAVTILEDLKKQLSQIHTNNSFPNLAEVRARVDLVLYYQYKKLMFYYLLVKRNPDKAEIWIGKRLQACPDDFDAYIGLARLYWEKGDKAGARRLTIAAKKLKPKDAIPLLNLAFFNFYDGKHKKGLAIYKTRLLKKELNTNTLDVAHFLEREYESTAKPALLFACGWINHKYADSKRGAEMLSKFLKITTGKNEFSGLRTEAEELLSQSS